MAYHTFTARDSQTIGTVTGGSKQTFEVNISVVVGDYIGICRSGGALYGEAVGDGYWVESGDATEGTGSFLFVADRTLSVYGTGITIDVGSPATVRPSVMPGVLGTFILTENPANATGIITSIEIYTRDDMYDVKIATFYAGLPPVTVTTLAPTLVEDGMANLRLELEEKSGLSINPVGWYCDGNATPSTEYIEIGWRAGIGEIDLSLGIYSKYVKTLPTGQTTLYVRAWADDSDDNRYTGSILSFDIPTEAEYLELPDPIFPEFPEMPEFILPELPEIVIELPAINFDISLDLYLDRTYTRKDIEELKQKCINYEKNYTDFCLVLNHNTILVKNFLQSVYNNGVLGGENEMFAKVYPSQQLKILYLEPLKPIDFKGIINRFINNNTSNSMGLNHNFDLFTEWLNDYNYTSDGYKASHIMPKEEIITNNEPTVKYMKRKIDKLQKEVSVSSREIKHNFDLMKEIIQ